jgi:hypothetical protein
MKKITVVALVLVGLVSVGYGAESTITLTAQPLKDVVSRDEAHHTAVAVIHSRRQKEIDAITEKVAAQIRAAAKDEKFLLRVNFAGLDAEVREVIVSELRDGGFYVTEAGASDIVTVRWN